MLEPLLEGILAVFAEALLEILGDLAWVSIQEKIEERGWTAPLLATLGFILLGSVAGLASAALFPERMTPVVLMPGLSLLLAPLGTGAVMHVYGRWRQRRGHDTSYLATFRGGAVTALAMALIRYILVH